MTQTKVKFVAICVEVLDKKIKTKKFSFQKEGRHPCLEK
jgi:hypothetical protein